MPDLSTRPRPIAQPPREVPPWRVYAAFAAVYLCWGSTYLAMRYAIETLPPFVMAGLRFSIAGALLYGWARLRGAPRPALAQWKPAAVVGVLMPLIGNGSVVWAVQQVPSSLAALLIASTPLWMVLLDWAGPGGDRPAPRVLLGVAAGMVGVMTLVGPGGRSGSHPIAPLGALVLLMASLSWAIGSLYARRVRWPASPLIGTGMQLLAGGFFLLATGLVAGEGPRLHPSGISASSILALVYLVVAGSLLGYTSYVWLLRVASPASVSTYAYVNPVVAVALGWALAGEVPTPRTLVAATIIVASVALITTAPSQGKKRKR
jgi:drug/metabolite transporter (DMT)-like permease